MLGPMLWALSAGAVDNGALQPAREPKSGQAGIKGLPAHEGQTRKAVSKSPAHEARDARARDASIGLNVAPGEAPPRVWASPQFGSAGTQPAVPDIAPGGVACVGVTCVSNSSADDAKNLATLCPGHPDLLRSSAECESKTVSSTWVVGGGDTHNEGSNMDPRTMWIVRASKKNVPGCSTFLSHPCGIENCVTSNGHGACVKPKPGTCAAACKAAYGKQGTYINGLEPFVDAQCEFTYNSTYREENITAKWESSRGGTRWSATGAASAGPASNVSQCSCFTGRHIEADVKYNQLNGSHRREYVALCEDEGYTAAPGREHPFEKRDVRRDGENMPNLEAKNGTPSQTNMPSRRDGESTGALTCFPSASTVTLADGVTHRRMDELRHGDAVRAVTREGKLTTDTVSFLSLANAAAVATFVRITTEGGEVVTLTPEHRLPVGEACCGTLEQAKDVERGDTIWVAAGGGGAAPAPQRIAATARVEAKGLHSPVLTHGAFPLVEEACVTNPLAEAADAACSRAGVVTAFDSLGYVDLASYGVPLIEPICKAMGMCSAVRRALLGSGGSYVQIRDRKSVV